MTQLTKKSTVAKPKRRRIIRPPKPPTVDTPTTIKTPNVSFKIKKTKGKIATSIAYKPSIKSPQLKLPKPPKHTKPTGVSENYREGNPNIGRISRERAINRRLSNGYPIELAVLYARDFAMWRGEWDAATTDQERDAIRRTLSAPIKLMHYVSNREELEHGRQRMETDAEFTDRQYRLYEYYMLNPETSPATTTATQEETLEPIEATDSTNNHENDSESDLVGTTLIRSNDELYYTKDRKFRVAKKGNRWKVMMKNAKKNVYISLFTAATLEEAVAKIRERF